MTPIVTIFDEIVAAVRARYDAVNGEQPYYMHGHPIEIGEIVSLKSQNSEWQYKRYPFICLFQDFDETHTSTNFSATLNIAIVMKSKQDYRAEDRYNDTFVNVLYPLYELFIQELKKSKYLDLSPANISFTKTDRLMWGRSNQNVLNDFVDAIEITDLKLTFHKFC